MTRKGTYESECGPKIKYSKWEARMATYRLRDQGYWDMGPYSCTYCRHWHVGHSGVRRRPLAFI